MNDDFMFPFYFCLWPKLEYLKRFYFEYFALMLLEWRDNTIILFWWRIWLLTILLLVYNQNDVSFVLLSPGNCCTLTALSLCDSHIFVIKIWLLYRQGRLFKSRTAVYLRIRMYRPWISTKQSTTNSFFPHLSVGLFIIEIVETNIQLQKNELLGHIIMRKMRRCWQKQMYNWLWW